MEKRFQIFISSTFADLIDERRAIQQAVLSLDHFPAGMELFPATDDDQWQLIKSVIDFSDYYVIVVGGRYGSMNEDGISYTEMEFDYAVSKGIPILAFVHENPDSIAAGKTDKDDTARERLAKFREKVCADRHVKFWKSAEQLMNVVLQALVTETKKRPQEGWVRASQASDPATLAKLRLELDELKASEPPKDSELLEGGTDVVELTAEFADSWRDPYRPHTVKMTWDEVFTAVGPLMMQETTDNQIQSRLASELLGRTSTSGASVVATNRSGVDATTFDTVKVQLFALGLIQRGKLKRTPSDKNVYWTLTNYGEDYLMKMRARKRP
ncbi:DUF4062 domain-containing protein [Maricaulis sp.]|uniref:DUF4062 domain-containing protein n=1 Tax=Maricaulis sp. TaxID=1486257 RepID=UPI003A93C9D6